MTAYYNEIDPYAAQWLENLMDMDLIPWGLVDRRSIKEVTFNDVKGFTQCHFFAGIGGWGLALRLAEWPDSRPVWTGSCPCQPFSAAGKRKGKEDERHLWPDWYRLIRECRPPIIFGEQVASAITAGWWDDVAADLEAEAYTCAAAVLPACSVGAPHRRNRLWFVGNSEHNGWDRGQIAGRDAPPVYHNPQREISAVESPGASESGDVADPVRARPAGGSYVGNSESSGWPRSYISEERNRPTGGIAKSNTCILGNTLQPRLEGHAGHEQNGGGRKGSHGSAASADSVQWIECPDGKARPVKPGIRLLAHGIPARVGRLRAYGNAIVPQVAAEFIKAFNTCRP